MKQDWWSCDGVGIADRRLGLPFDPSASSGLRENGTSQPARSGDYSLSLTPTRRQLLAGTALSLVAWMAGSETALADVAVAPGRRQPKGDILVSIFLRGGADGLNIVAPHGEDAYHRNRPTLRLGSPKDNRIAKVDRALDLDGFFGLHPALAPLLPLYRSGILACLHACGSGDQTRSHFEAMSAMERGIADPRSGAASGWLARHLAATQPEVSSPLRAVAFSSVMPDSLRGATDATVLNSLADFRLALPEGITPARTAELKRALSTLYDGGKDAISQAGRETLAVLDTMNRIDPAHYRPAGGATYPEGELGTGLKQVACLIKSGVGLEVAFLDKGGWDTHIAQGSSGGILAAELDHVGKSLAAFAADMGPEMKRVTVVVMTEFGRRLRENGQLGTDHGRGSFMMVMGGGVKGGKVHARWPGLEPQHLEEPGDLRVTTDYRDVLAEILVKRVHNDQLATVFPGYRPSYLGVVG